MRGAYDAIAGVCLCAVGMDLMRVFVYFFGRYVGVYFGANEV